MSIETVDTLVVGAGQAGVAVSDYFGKQGKLQLAGDLKDNLTPGYRNHLYRLEEADEYVPTHELDFSGGQARVPFPRSRPV